MSTFNPALTSAFKPAWTPVWGLSAITDAIKALFVSGQQGVWYDPSDFSTLFQDAAGTTPVTAVEQPVGLMLDKRLGLVRGAEVAVNGTFDTDSAWTKAANWTISGGAANSNGGTGFLQAVTSPLVVGKVYEATMLVTSFVSGQVSYPYSGSGVSYVAAAGVHRWVFTAAATTLYVHSAAFSGSIDNVSVRELPGNHATQATAASRPVVSARVNLLTSSEDFSNAVWAKVLGVTTTGPNTLNFPNVTSGERFEFNTSTVAVANTAVTFGLELSGTGTINIAANTTTGVGGNSEITVTLTAVPTRYLVTVTYNAAPTGNPRVFIIWRTGNTATQVTANRAQFELGTTATRYQRVNTATDYDTAGFPMYDRLDGVDDSMTSATGGGGTAGFFWCGAVKVTGAAGVTRVVFDDRGANSGYLLRIDSSGIVAFFAGNGTVLTNVSTAGAVVIGTTALITAWDDGTNLNVQLDRGAVATIARPVVAAGTAGFTLGKVNGVAADFFSGNFYSSVYRQGSGLTAAERAQVQAYVRSKAGL